MGLAALSELEVLSEHAMHEHHTETTDTLTGPMQGDRAPSS